MKRVVLIAVILAVLVIDWLALDDITTGNEPSLLAEYLIVSISLPILAVIGYFLFRKST